MQSKKKYKDPNFSFSSVTSSNLENELKGLGSSKSVHETDILTKLLKENMDFFSRFLLNYYNDIIDSSSFPNRLKLANITPVHKKDTRKNKRNYRTVSARSNTSNFFENILNHQNFTHLENFFSEKQTGFRKGFDA